MAEGKILIIDDDSDDIDILSDALHKSGVKGVHNVNTAIKAFMYLESIRTDGDLPSLIVTDLYLPGITGAEFLKDLKTMDRYKNVPVVVLATVKSETEIARYKAMGAADYLVKPSSYKEYLQVAEYMKARASVSS